MHRPLDPNTGKPLPIAESDGPVAKGHAKPELKIVDSKPTNKTASKKKAKK